MDLAAKIQLALEKIRLFSLESSDPIHLLVATEILAKESAETNVIPLLAKELAKACRCFAHFLQTNPSAETLFTPEGSLALDACFANYLQTLGPKGKELSQEVFSASKQWKCCYDKDPLSTNIFKLWLDPERPPYNCRYLPLLAEIVWKDHVQTQIHKTIHYLPAFTQSIQRPLMQLLSSKTKVCHQDQSIQLVHGTTILAEVKIADPTLTPFLLQGARSFSSIYHHKLLRLQCSVGFDQWAQGKDDPQIIRYEGGSKELATILGFRSKEAPAILKALLIAQAHFLFHLDEEEKKPLIQIAHFLSEKTRRDEGLEITMSPPLMPYYTFQAHRKARLLVPLPLLPPFVSAPQYHAKQALLQMLLMEEFTNQSIELASEGSISMNDAEWDSLVQRSTLPPTIANEVRKGWNQEEVGESCFKWVDTRRLTFGCRYRKEKDFLVRQGQLRKERTVQGKLSVKKRKH